MIPERIRAVLRDAGVPYCVIGAHALAAHGVARFTADVDLLTMDRRVLEPELWPGDLRPEIRRGDDDDPLEGVARFEEPTVDVIVGRGEVMRRAVDEASVRAGLEDPVVTARSLALLKLEAGGVQDLADVELLIEAVGRAGADLRAEVDAHRSALSDWGRRKWDEVRRRMSAD